MVKTTNQPHILRYFLSSIPWKNHHVWTSEVTAISFGRRSALSPWRFWMPWMGAVWKERSVKPMVNHHFPYWMILNGYNWRKLEVFCPFPWNKYGTWSFPYLWFIIISVIFHINSISIKFPEPRRFPWYKWVRCALIPPIKFAEESTAADQSMHRFGAKTLWPTRGSVSSLGCLWPLVRCVLRRELSGMIHVITFVMSSSHQPPATHPATLRKTHQ